MHSDRRLPGRSGERVEDAAARRDGDVCGRDCEATDTDGPEAGGSELWINGEEHHPDVGGDKHRKDGGGQERYVDRGCISDGHNSWSESKVSRD